ncbi:hypothetical protein [Sutcliffiella rhizosphaerae]|uniref:DUF3592 domain-containing protein n=1 Tax=Sutcliffiella rhizosphaerae TaxID=2880967 RepID=A0ABM8YNM7_9BACI|nr:hypothetical protein [Sutcliffiella rhizosphaerae]CAG9621598.1 hypothetical protein BACCIP111883_02371 [Sutcliffiella rhizosphaerae]
MKRIMTITLLLIFMLSHTIHALSWAFPFVVWQGKVYEAKVEEIIPENDINKIIGEVKTQPNDMTGNYYGDASNYYPSGTKYYEIKGILTSTAIAVKENNQWVKAVYDHDAPFHIMNVISNFYFIASVILLALIVGGVVFRKKSKTR